MQERCAAVDTGGLECDAFGEPGLGPPLLIGLCLIVMSGKWRGTARAGARGS